MTFLLQATIPESEDDDGNPIPEKKLIAQKLIPFIDIDESVSTEKGLAYMWFQETAEVTDLMTSTPFVINSPYIVPPSADSNELAGYMCIAYKASEDPVKSITIDGESALGGLSKDTLMSDGIEWVVYITKREVEGIEGGEILLSQHTHAIGIRRILGEWYKNISNSPIFKGQDVDTNADDTVAERLGEVVVTSITIPTVGSVFTAKNTVESTTLHFHITNTQEIESVEAVYLDEREINGATFEIDTDTNTVVVTYTLSNTELSASPLQVGLVFNLEVTLKADPDTEVFLPGISHIDTNQLFSEGVILIAAQNGRPPLTPTRNSGITKGSAPSVTASSLKEALEVYSTFNDNSILDSQLQVNPIILCLDAFVLKEEAVLQVPAGCRIFAPYATFEGGLVSSNDCVIQFAVWHYTQAEIGVDTCLEVGGMRNISGSDVIVIGNDETDVHRSTSVSIKKIEGIASFLLRGGQRTCVLSHP